MEKYLNGSLIESIDDIISLNKLEEFKEILKENDFESLDELFYNNIYLWYNNNVLDDYWSDGTITDDNISLCKINENELSALFIDYDQFLAYCNDIILNVNGNEYVIKYSLYGNIIEIVDDEIYPYFDSIIEVLKNIDFEDMRKFQNFKDEINENLPFITVNFMPTAFNEYTCYYNVKGSE